MTKVRSNVGWGSGQWNDDANRLARHVVGMHLPGVCWLISHHRAGMEQLEEIGTPTVLVVPNAYHRSDAALYKQRFPELEVLCPAAALEKVSEVRRTARIARQPV